MATKHDDPTTIAAPPAQGSPFSINERRYIDGILVEGECDNCNQPLGTRNGYLLHLKGGAEGDSRGCGYWRGYKLAKLRAPGTPPTKLPL